MRKLSLGFMLLAAVSIFCGCGKSAKQIAKERQDSLKRAVFLKDSLQKDSIFKDSIRWEQTTSDLSFHSLKGPIQECKYKVVEGIDEGKVFVVRFDRHGYLTSDYFLSADLSMQTSFQRDKKGRVIKVREGKESGPYRIVSYYDNGLVKAIGCEGYKDEYTYEINHIYPENITRDEGEFNYSYAYKEFDKHGNWTRCDITCSSSIGSYIETVVRTITAYPLN